MSAWTLYTIICAVGAVFGLALAFSLRHKH